MELTLDFLVELLDYASDEIYILDKNLQIVFVNRACERHYGLTKSEVIGKHNTELFERGLWTPSIIPYVMESEDTISVKQRTYIGNELLTRAFKIRDDEGQLQYIFITSTEIRQLKTERAVKNITAADNPPVVKTLTLVYKSKKMQEIVDFCEKIAPSDTTVLIQGESGTGKGVIARHIHKISQRATKPFVSINCASLPEELVEAELFGYASGAFTGARATGREGLFSIANGGTVFLDEVGELDIATQAKLLQVIQEKSFIPVGSSTETKVDVRIITATNRDLWKMVQQGQFREDLFYRLNVIDFRMPSLRERKEDIVSLVYTFLNKFNDKFNMNKMISDRCLQLLIHYDWPGNVRQLENLMERLVLTSDHVIDVTDLPDLIIESTEQETEDGEPLWTLDNRLNQMTKQIIEEAYHLKKTTRGIAAYLGISQSRAYRLMKKYKITEDTCHS